MIRILIADAEEKYYDALRATLEQEDDFYLLGCAQTVAELRYLLPHSNLVLITSALDEATMADLITLVGEADATIKKILFGIEDDPDLILSYIESGADGYVLAQEPPQQLLRKARAAHEERAIVSPAVAGEMLERISELAELAPSAAETAVANPFDALTPREMDVLQLIVAELTNQEIAEKLVIGTGTVKNHVHNILKKLRVNTRYEAADLYREQRGGS